MGKNKVVGCLSSAKRDEARFERIERQQAERGSKIKEYKCDMKQVESFRYRMQNALRSVTRTAVREARLEELKSEILNSEKLKAHFEENPHDLEYLERDKPLHPARVQTHMKHIPKYVMPRTGFSAAVSNEFSADLNEKKSDLSLSGKLLRAVVVEAEVPVLDQDEGKRKNPIRLESSVIKAVTIRIRSRSL